MTTYMHRSNYTPYTQLGFIDIAAGITSMVASLASAGTNIYGTLKTLELQEEQFELQEELSLRRMTLEEQLSAAQQRMIAVQTSGLEERQTIDMQIAELQKEAIEEQLEQVKRQQEMQTRLQEERAQLEIERIEWQRAQEQAQRDAYTQMIEEQKALDALAYQQQLPAGGTSEGEIATGGTTSAVAGKSDVGTAAIIAVPLVAVAGIAWWMWKQ